MLIVKINYNHINIYIFIYTCVDKRADQRNRIKHESE